MVFAGERNWIYPISGQGPKYILRNDLNWYTPSEGPPDLLICHVWSPS